MRPNEPPPFVSCAFEASADQNWERAVETTVQEVNQARTRSRCSFVIREWASGSEMTQPALIGFRIERIAFFGQVQPRKKLHPA